MINYRNPFRMRASEKIESDSTFLRLYSPIALESLKEKFDIGKLWNNVLFIQSSPGGGKTSLLRLFSPSSLNTLYNYRTNPYFSPLIKTLFELKIFNENGIQLLGIFISCAKNYEILEDLKIGDVDKFNIFFSLLNSRILITTLKEILNFKKLKFPDDLDKIKFSHPNIREYLGISKYKVDGKELYKWAVDREKRIYSSTSGFAPIPKLVSNLNEELFSISLLNREFITINEKPVANNILIMLDDVHKLSKNQRFKLKEVLIEKRANVNVWISERLEALEPQELLPYGAYIGRDYEKINLEEFWNNNYGKFEKIIRDIADKRVKISKDIQISSFNDVLEDYIDEDRFSDNINKSIDHLMNSIEKNLQNNSRFSNWLNYVKNFHGSKLEKAILLQKLEILIYRNLRKTQLAFDFPLSIENFQEKESSNLESVAEFFLSKKYNLPYYYGLRNIIKLSNFNIEQFLSFSADIFEDIVAKSLTGNNLSLIAERQEAILKKIVGRKWIELPKIIPYGQEVRKFLIKFGELSEQETDKISAPYAPGVTGIGIKMDLQRFIINEKNWIKNSGYEDLINVISTCISYNLIRADIDKSQGIKDRDKWMVLYLNRWLCINFKLPLNYGGWRPKTPQELIEWIQ